MLRRLPNVFTFCGRQNELLNAFRPRFLAMVAAMMVNANISPRDLNSNVMAMIQLLGPVSEHCCVSISQKLFNNFWQASHLPSDGNFLIQSHVFGGEGRLTPSCEFLENYLSVMEKFIGGEHKHSRYETVSWKFIGSPGSSELPE
jgi:hypothetical protein